MKKERTNERKLLQKSIHRAQGGWRLERHPGKRPTPKAAAGTSAPLAAGSALPKGPGRTPRDPPPLQNPPLHTAGVHGIVPKRTQERERANRSSAHRPLESGQASPRVMAATSGRSSAASVSLFSGKDNDAALPGLLVALMTLFVSCHPVCLLFPLLAGPALPCPLKAFCFSFPRLIAPCNFARYRMVTVRTRSPNKSGWKET